MNTHQFTQIFINLMIMNINENRKRISFLSSNRDGRRCVCDGGRRVHRKSLHCGTARGELRCCGSGQLCECFAFFRWTWTAGKSTESYQDHRWFVVFLSNYRSLSLLSLIWFDVHCLIILLCLARNRQTCGLCCVWSLRWKETWRNFLQIQISLCDSFRRIEGGRPELLWASGILQVR